MLDKLGETRVPLEEIPARLAAAADELIRLRADLTRLRDDRPEFATLRARASALIDQGEFDAARAVLREGREAARALRKELSRSEAGFLLDEGRLNKLQLDYDAALENFEEASHLDPDNCWIWIELGDLWIFLGSLAKAEQAFRAALEAALVSKDERDLSVSHNKIGDVQRAQGDLPAALTSYQASHDISERLAKADPGNAGWQRDLSVSHERIGDVQAGAGRSAGGADELSGVARDRRASGARRTRATPAGSATCRCRTSKIGDVQRAQGNLPAALTSYQASLAIAERLAKADPGNAGWQRDLSVSHNKIGDVLRAQGNLPAALTSYQASLAICRASGARRTRATPAGSATCRCRTSKIGDVQRAQGNLPAALTSYQASLAIRERLAQADPGNAGWQRDLSVSHNKIGDVLQAQGDLAAALTSYQASLAIAERLAQADPGNAGWQRDLSVVAQQDRRRAAGAGQPGGGADELSGLARDLRASGASGPGNAGWQRDLAVSHNKIGDVQRSRAIWRRR